MSSDLLHLMADLWDSREPISLIRENHCFGSEARPSPRGRVPIAPMPHRLTARTSKLPFRRELEFPFANDVSVQPARGAVSKVALPALHLQR